MTVIAHRRSVGIPVVVAQLACVIAIVASWQVVAGRAAVGDQSVWLDVAVAAAVVSGVVNGAWLLRLRRTVAARRRALLGFLDTAGDGHPPRAADVVVSGDGALVAVVGGDLVHRVGCALVAGKQIEPATADGEPCGWCQP